MTLRIIGGEYRGRLLKTVRGIGTRPLLSQVREAVFNILAAEVVDAEVWDLFAGTGANGIEALSRGARRVHFVEKNKQALAVLQANLEMLGEAAMHRSRVLRGDAWLPPQPEGDEPPIAPDLIFFDPPYPAVAEDPVRAAYIARGLAHRLSAGGVLAFHFRQGQLDTDDFDLDLEVRMREWGTSAFVFLRRKPAIKDRD